MKFIRDIINEKKLAAGADDAAAPRAPLTLTPEYRSSGGGEAAPTGSGPDQAADAPAFGPGTVPAAGAGPDDDGLADALHALGFENDSYSDWTLGDECAADPDRGDGDLEGDREHHPEDDLKSDPDDGFDDAPEPLPARSWGHPAAEDSRENDPLEDRVFGADVVKDVMENRRPAAVDQNHTHRARPAVEPERPEAERPERRPYRGMNAAIGAALREERPPVQTAPAGPAAPQETPAGMVRVPSPAAGRGAGSSGRVKTRLLGFGAPEMAGLDPIAKKETPAPAAYSRFPVGWLIVTDGPGKGAAFTLHEGLSQIGRAEGQTVQLSFGDNSISRENHAAIAYDAEQRCFYFGHGGKANLVRLNGRPVLSTEELPSESEIRIGETTLRFVALCGQNFSWGADQQDDTRHAVRG